MKRIEIYIGLSVFALSAKSQVKESRPNVIYIIMDVRLLLSIATFCVVL